MLDDVLPASLELEQTVIGSILVNNSGFWTTQAEIDPPLDKGDFTDPVHKKIWEGIERTVKRGLVADERILAHVLDDFVDDRNVPARYVQAIAEAARTVMNIESYCVVLRDLRIRREAIEDLRLSLKELQDQNDDLTADDRVGVIRGRIDGLRTRLAGSSDWDQLADDLLQQSDSPTQITSTTFAALDHSMAGGLVPGRVYGIYANPKGFKTGVATTLACRIALAGSRVAIISTELSKEEIGQRIIAHLGKFYPSQFRYRNNTEVNDWIMRSRSLLSGSLFIRRPRDPTLDVIQAEIENLIQTKQICGFFLDYWQRVESADGRTDRFTHLTDVARWLESVTTRANIWAVTTAQLKDGKPYYGDTLNQICSWIGYVNKTKLPKSKPEFGSEGVTELWIENKFARHGPIRHCGSEEAPAFWIDPRGPALGSNDLIDAPSV